MHKDTYTAVFDFDAARNILNPKPSFPSSDHQAANASVTKRETSKQRNNVSFFLDLCRIQKFDSPPPLPRFVSLSCLIFQSSCFLESVGMEKGKEFLDHCSYAPKIPLTCSYVKICFLSAKQHCRNKRKQSAD